MRMRRYRNPCSYLNRRLQIVASLLSALALVFLLGTSSPDTPVLRNVPYIQQGASKVVQSLPQNLPHVNTAQWLNRLDPFHTPAHAPPPADQPDSRSGDIAWFSDFKWLNPFSTAVPQDERAVLPPLAKRPPVYTYFDAGGRDRDEKSRKAEQSLLEIWRRAWWAQGFKPVILSRSEAKNHPQYARVAKMDLEPDMEMEMLRWLAWANMGTGILANWLALPMAHYDDEVLTFLRNGEFDERIVRFQALESGLFVGTSKQVEAAIEIALESKILQTASHMYQVVPDDTFAVENDHEGIAFYSSKTIRTTYKPIADKLDYQGSRGEGLAMLIPLINSHLHLVWQNTFIKGIAVMKPLAKNTTYMIDPAIDIARNLSTCSVSPMQSSCPPNKPKCRPCVSMTPMVISTPPIYRNDSAQFLIGTIPHPYTLQTLIHDRDGMDVRFLRRETKRDVWIVAATKEILGTGISSFARLAPFKDAVASQHGSSRSLWLTAEEPLYLRTEADMQELDWVFGFEIPRHPLKSGKSETPVPGPERRPAPKQEFDGPKPSVEQLLQQKTLNEKAQHMLKRSEHRFGHKALMSLRNAVEAWNMADAEAWKFVRAFNARRLVERQKWQKEEEAYLGAGLFDRWRDTLTG